jgi:hypothetical protein
MLYSVKNHGCHSREGGNPNFLSSTESFGPRLNLSGIDSRKNHSGMTKDRRHLPIMQQHYLKTRSFEELIERQNPYSARSQDYCPRF